MEVFDGRRRPDFFLALPPGVVLGVAIAGPVDASWLLSVDSDGVFWSLRDGVAARRGLARWSLERGLRVYPSLGLLAEAVELGRCVGLVRAFAVFRWHASLARRGEVVGCWSWPGLGQVGQAEGPERPVEALAPQTLGHPLGSGFCGPVGRFSPVQGALSLVAGVE